MRTYRLARIVSILLFLAAAIYLIGGFVFGARLWSRGLGDGWGSGFAGWLSIPIFIGAFFGALTLLMFGVVLYFLTAINHNLTLVRQSNAFVAPQPEAQPAAPAAAPVMPPVPRVAPEPIAEPPRAEPAAQEIAPSPAVESPQAQVTAPTADAAAPVAISPELLAELPGDDADAEAVSQAATGQLPGAEQAARIASELAAAKNASET